MTTLAAAVRIDGVQARASTSTLPGTKGMFILLDVPGMPGAELVDVPPEKLAAIGHALIALAAKMPAHP